MVMFICGGLNEDFIYKLLLLKIILSVKRYYVCDDFYVY